jgi:hypothetical protein
MFFLPLQVVQAKTGLCVIGPKASLARIRTSTTARDSAATAPAGVARPFLKLGGWLMVAGCWLLVLLGACCLVLAACCATALALCWATRYVTPRRHSLNEWALQRENFIFVAFVALVDCSYSTVL